MIKIIEIENAKTMREKAKPQAEINQLNAIIREQQELQELEKNIAEAIESIAKKINKIAENGDFNFSMEVYNNSFYNDYCNSTMTMKIVKKIAEIFNNAGYETYIHEYSSSWFYKTGKVCNLYISW